LIVQRVNKILDKYGLESLNDVVSVGDVVLSVDGVQLVPVRIEVLSVVSSDFFAPEFNHAFSFEVS
jgi:hypothetical protein